LNYDENSESNNELARSIREKGLLQAIIVRLKNQVLKLLLGIED
jgi:ParB-like chromosome segregation protein Spo0J